MPCEMTIPRKRGETNLARGLTFFAFAFTSLAIYCLYCRVAPIASSLWLVFIATMFWMHLKGGLRALLVDWVGALAGRQFVHSTMADANTSKLTFGFELLGHRFVQLAVMAYQIVSVKWSSVPASGWSGRDRDDWTAWLSFDHADPATSPKTSIVPGAELGLWIIGATTRSEETEAFGLTFVQFLRNAGAKLVPGNSPRKYVRDDSGAPEPI